MKNPFTSSINTIKHSRRRSPRRNGFLLIPLACTLLALALSPLARAACQQGCDTVNNNTFLGDNALISNTTGSLNTATGHNALFSNATGYNNTANGAEALYSNTGGSFNTANGVGALQFNSIAYNNTANGYRALGDNTTGSINTATGSTALSSNTTGEGNTANGSSALFKNTIGDYNTANGTDALFSNSTGNNNTANGYQALYNNTTGYDNTANGTDALYFNTTGFYNTANGLNALYSNTTGSDNLANGRNALQYNTTGSLNTANGDGALLSNTTGSNNTADGYLAMLYNTAGSNNIALGILAGQSLTTGNNNIDIGNAGVAGESSTIRIGTKPAQKATFIAGISGVTVASGVGVIINTQGKLGTVVSSARYKDNIRAMGKDSEALLNLQPVTFRYKKELDPQAIPQFGLVAEEVAKVNPDLVARDDDGKPYSVRYDAVNAMLLNEFLKEHRKVESLRATSAQQESTNIELKEELKLLKATLKEQAAQIQKVSAQLNTQNPAPRVVANN